VCSPDLAATVVHGPLDRLPLRQRRAVELRPLVTPPVASFAALRVARAIVTALAHAVALAALHSIAAIRSIAAVVPFVPLRPVEALAVHAVVLPVAEALMMASVLAAFAAMLPLLAAALRAHIPAPALVVALAIRNAGDRRLFAVGHILSAVFEMLPLGVRTFGTHAGLVLLAGVSARLPLLLTVGENDPVVVLCMLQIVLGQHRVAGKLRIPRQRHVLLGDVSGRAAHFHLRPVRLEAARERVLALALVTAVVLPVAAAVTPAMTATVAVVAAATAPVLLTLPHRISFSRSRRIQLEFQ
jgi:hypothetical protein